MLDDSDCRTSAMKMPWTFVSLLRRIIVLVLRSRSPLKVEHLQESQWSVENSRRLAARRSRAVTTPAKLKSCQASYLSPHTFQFQ